MIRLRSRAVTAIGILAPMLALLLFATAALAEAEPAPPEAARPMDALDFLVGDWKGEGWILTRDGKRETFSSSEVIRRKLMGTALLIEGTHTGFEAMAVVTHDAKAGQYRWRSFTSRGGGVDTEVKITGDRTLEWYPSEHSRYTIRITDAGQWEEVGEYSRDGGETWTPFFGMSLQRVQE